MTSPSLPTAIVALSRALGGRTKVSQRCAIPDHLLVDWAFGIGAPDAEQWTALYILASRAGVDFPRVPSSLQGGAAYDAGAQDGRAEGAFGGEPESSPASWRSKTGAGNAFGSASGSASGKVAERRRASEHPSDYPLEQSSRRLSVEEEQPVRPSTDPRRQRRALPVTVLVVDDDVHFRSALRELLERHGFEVEEAENGVDALEKLMSAALAPDLLLIDLKMPQMDGTALLSALKAREGLAAIPAIVVSGYASSKCIPGAQRVYLKDDTLTGLVDDVRALVGAAAPTRH